VYKLFFAHNIVLIDETWEGPNKKLE